MSTRVLLILTEFPPRIGGMQTHAIHLARYLHDRGYVVEVVTYRIATRIEQECAEEHDAVLPFEVHRVMSRLAYFRNHELIEGIAATFGPVLVYCSTVFYGRLAESLGVPVLSRSVGNDILRPWIAYPFRPLQGIVGHPMLEDRIYKTFRRFDYPEIIETFYRRRRRRLMEDSARRLTTIFANSAFTADLLDGIGVREECVDVLTGGVDSARFDDLPPAPDLRGELGIPEDGFVMVTVCRLVKKKGVDFLLTAMEALLAEQPDAYLVIMGGGRHDRKLRRIAAASPAADHIVFAGRIPHDDVHAFYSMADLFVLASRIQVDPLTGLRDAETMGRVLCEANAAGLPVVAARSGGIPSVIEDGVNGLLFEPDDVPTYLDAVARVRADNNLRNSLAANGREIAREAFDWSVIGARHEAFFDKVLDGQERPVGGV